jgi:hypothetical protein
VVIACGRLRCQGRKGDVSQVFAGQRVGVKQVDEHIWLVTIMQYDFGYFDDNETCRLEPIENPFVPNLSLKDTTFISASAAARIMRRSPHRNCRSA